MKILPLKNMLQMEFHQRIWNVIKTWFLGKSEIKIVAEQSRKI